ncbi:hypothetical protein N9Q31_01595 [Pseudomonadales bacterium]|nr:hypothetical protein [Pseudomonadales bacterium]
MNYAEKHDYGARTIYDLPPPLRLAINAGRAHEFLAALAVLSFD